MDRKVLVVDNNPFFLEVIRKTLESEGFSVLTLQDPVRALDAVKKERFDYILIDHIMPKIGGDKLCGYLKSEPATSGTPIIILTGVAIEMANRVKDIKADAYIAKSPVTTFVADMLGVISNYENGTDIERMKERVVGVDNIYPREMTRELIEIETHLSLVLATMSEGIIECDSEYKVFFVNRSALAIIGREESDIIGRNLFTVLGMGRNREIRSLFPSPATIRRNSDFHEKFCVPIGERMFSLHVNSLAIVETERGVLIVLEDITEQAYKIQTLSTVNNFAKILTSDLELEGVVQKTVEGFHQFLVPDTTVFLLYSETERAALTVESVAGTNRNLSPGYRLSSKFLADLCIEGGKTAVFIDSPKLIAAELGELSERLGYKPSNLIIQNIKFHDRCIGCLLFLNQKDPFRNYSDELLESLVGFSSIALENSIRYSKMKDLNIWRQNYMANISHELRTPLTIVKGFTEILFKGLIVDGQSREAVLGNMLSEVNKLVRLIDNLLTLSKFENIPITHKIKHTRVELHGIVKDAIEELRKDADARKLSFQTHFCRTAIYVNGDRDLLFQAVVHLLLNAVKYSHEGGIVRVSTAVSGNLLGLVIGDDGLGIPEEHIDRIFDKFYMVDDGLMKATRGAGIGLYLVREIVNLHFGNIHLTSKPGKGTTVSIKLPLDYSGM